MFILHGTNVCYAQFNPNDNIIIPSENPNNNHFLTAHLMFKDKNTRERKSG